MLAGVATASAVAAISAGPQITDIAPSSPVQNAAAQLLTINGSSFYEGLTVHLTTPDGKVATFDGDSVLIRRGTSIQLSAILAQSGGHSVLVGALDGSTSEPFKFDVVRAAETPTLQSTRPNKVSRGSELQTVAAFGTRFNASLSVIVTDPSGVTTTLDAKRVKWNSATSFEFSTTFDKAGEYFIIVSTPIGGKSNSMTIVAS